MESVQVIIVGGGAAGLAAAKTLGSEVNYILIEAQNYLGGRIQTIDAASNFTIDLGAQFVHGDKNNMVYDICAELDILQSNNDPEGGRETMVLTSGGETLESDLFEKATDSWKEATDKAREIYENQSGSSSVAFTDFVPQEFENRLKSSSISENLIKPFSDYCFKSEMIETSCLSLSDLNLIEYVNYEDLKGEYENILKNGGYRPFINHLKSFIPNDNRVRLNCEVTRVKFNGDDQKVLVDINDNNEKRNKTIVCDHVIWTTSLGHLKENFHRIFAEESQLIEQKQTAIANLGFGTANKIFLVYKKKFWAENASEIVLLHTQNNASFEMSDGLRQQLKAERVDAQLLQEIVQMLFHYDVLSSTDTPVLICWSVGQTALAMERLSTELVGQICHEVLCSCLNIPHQKYPLVNVFRSAWHSNPYIRGAYSYQSIRSTREDSKQLRASYEPDGVARILFAGEATHEKYYSNINAALETGIQAAENVLSLIE